MQRVLLKFGYEKNFITYLHFASPAHNPFFFFFEASAMVNAKRIEQKLPSLLVDNCSR